MLHKISLFVGSHQLSTFNIHSTDTILVILDNLNKNLTANFKSKINYLKVHAKTKKLIVSEINLLSRYKNVSQNSLIILSILLYYIRNNFKPFPVTLTCNDFKIESNIDLKNCNLNTEIYS